MKQHNPPHPGGFIKRIYLEPSQLSSHAVAALLQVSPSTFTRLINEQSSITPEMALKLSKVLGRSPESWLSMQDNYDLWEAKSKIDLTGYESIKFAM